MNRVKILIGSVIIVIVLGWYIGGFLLNDKSSDKIELKSTSSLVAKQEGIEKSFDTKGYTIDKPSVILDPYKVSPLTALILFETKSKVSPKVTIMGHDELTTYTHTFSKEKKHYLSIYGLYADSDNEVVIEYNEDGKDVRKVIKIRTNKLPDDFIYPTSINKDSSKLNHDLYFFTPSSKGYTCAYDVNGDVRWYLTQNALWNNTRLKNGHMLVSTERLINSPYYMTGLYEIDLLGKIYNEYSLKGGYHHDYYEMPNGNLLVASDDFNNDSGTVEDYVVEIKRDTGKIVRSFDLKDILNMKDGESENSSSYDWFHNNSVWYDKKTNSITLSGRHMDAVINISYKTGKLNWIIGDSSNWSKKYQKYFFKPVGDNFEWQWSQHAAMITPEGYVFLFDNGNNKSKDKDKYVSASDSYSRGVMYKIDTKKMTIEQVFEYGKERGSEFYSPYISDVDYLAKSHYIVHSGGIVYVDGKNSNQPAGLGGADKLVSDTVELLDDKVIFEMILPTNNYRVEKMSLYANDTYKKGVAKRLGSLGKTAVDEEKIGIIQKNKTSKKIPKKYKVNITKEEDRLVFKGMFKRGQDVKVVLYKEGNSKIYNVPISKKPYTALCVDIFTEEENKNGIEVIKYINKEGLKGDYSLYIKIDGKTYNTGKYIKF